MKLPGLLPYAQSLAGTLLAAREAVMAPIRPMLRQANITEQQWRILRVLNDEGALDPTRLAQLALLHAPSVTRILRDLLDRKLITRATDPTDGRRSFITITHQGCDLVDSTARHTQKVLMQYEARFGKQRLAALRRELAALTATIADCAGDVAPARDPLE
jgi:homoprotocatechuate degradation regulator HpaR